MSKNIVVFGTGLFYARRKKFMPNGTKIIAFIDNNAAMQGLLLDGVKVYAPSEIKSLDYDVIVLASVSTGEMKKQLLDMGISKNKIMYWEEYVSYISHGVLQKFEGKRSSVALISKKCLIIVPIVNLAGGFMTALYVACSLQKHGYVVTIAAPSGMNNAIEEANCKGIDVWISPAIPYIGEEEIKWIKEFDFVWANSLQTMLCVDRISVIKPVIWWLHENSDQYEDLIEQYTEVNVDNLKKADAYAVSALAKKNFNQYLPQIDVNILPLGVSDFYIESNNSSKEKIVIAVIGTICKRKNQLELISAIEQLSQKQKNQIECWIIGKDGSKQYRREVDQAIQGKEYIRFLGELNRNEIKKVFSEIDIVVCCSLEETFSIVIVEGMMNKKICVTTTNTGVAQFIEDGKNGFVYETQNINELITKLDYIISNFQQLSEIQNNAREVYDKQLSIKVFEENLIKILKNNDIY